MKATRTFYIGLIVALISFVQYLSTFESNRIIGIAVGLFFIVWGWKIGWTRYRNFTVLVGHIAVVTGCIVVAYAIYQIPFLKIPPTFLQVLDTPLFWGLFTIWGGNCMITHGYCSCMITMHQKNNKMGS